MCLFIPESDKAPSVWATGLGNNDDDIRTSCLCKGQRSRPAWFWEGWCLARGHLSWTDVFQHRGWTPGPLQARQISWIEQISSQWGNMTLIFSCPSADGIRIMLAMSCKKLCLLFRVTITDDVSIVHNEMSVYNLHCNYSRVLSCAGAGLCQCLIDVTLVLVHYTFSCCVLPEGLNNLKSPQVSKPKNPKSRLHRK